MRNKSRLLVFIVISLCLSGCVLEEPFIGEYCPAQGEEGKLSYISTSSGVCEAKNCTSSDACCGIEDKSLRKLIWKRRALLP